MHRQDPIARRKLHQVIQQRLLERIEAGDFAPGQPLPSERELMQTYQVGRPAVREAMQALAHAGVIEIAHGERARVRVPSAAQLIERVGIGAQHWLRVQPESLEHLQDARTLLECSLAARAAERADGAALSRLRELLERQRAALSDVDAFVRADMAFHREIAEIAGNPIFPPMIVALFEWAGEFHRPMVHAPGGEPLTLSEHERIIEAVGARDPSAASAAMRAHLTRADARYRQRSTPPPGAA